MLLFGCRAMRQKFVIKLDLHDRAQEEKALQVVSKIPGVESVTADLRDGKMTVIGDGVDPLLAVSKLRWLFGHAQLVSVAEVKDDDGGGQEDKSGATTPYEFTVEFLKRITSNFSEERIIGRGRHGVVYKGVQDNGVCIAVKKLHLMPGLDNEEFKNEFYNLLRVRHQNTILLLGYCHHTSQVLVEHNGKHISARVEERSLCSEYLQGGSLEKHLSNGPCVLAWHTCYKIIKGICEGLHYLHKGFEYPIYHLELKPTKILLDNDMMPKIGGFGFSRLFDATETFRTSEVTRTSVYMPSEYISKRQITPKFDVFSLGIIILQMMSGKESYTKCADMPPKEFTELVYGFWVNRMQGTISKHTSREVRTCIEIALKCVEFSPENRPTINEIIQKLNKIDIVECSSIGQLYRTKEFSFEFLESITNGFSEQNIVGHGGYGVIYKGLLDNGEEIAVKKLYQMLCIDDEQFKNEVNNLMRVQHRNIVQLVGYCCHTSQIFVEYEGKHVSASVVEKAICFEYMQGGSLGDQLSAESCKLDWDKCYKIIKGICEGLHYLHNSVTPIYHLDLKPANILLDKDMVAKIGDFGMSRLFDSASRVLKGTLGYMPPEYINGQKISPKFDVFSLGVIIIQIMAGTEGYFNCRYTPPKEFIEHVHEKWRVRLQATMSSHVSEEVRTCIEIALKCVEDDRTRRPTIAQIVNELSNIGIAKSSLVGQVQATVSPHVSEEVRTCSEIALKCVEDDRTRRPTIAQIVNELNNIGTAQSSPLDQALLGSISMRPLAGKLDMLLIAPPQGCSSESVKDGMQLLREDVEEISSYLDELSEVEEPPPTAKCWMNEAHDLSCDIEDYIDGLLFVQPAEPSRLSNNIKSTRSRLKLSGHAKAPKRLKPRHEQIAGRVSEFSMFVQKAIERYQRYDLHSCSSLRRRFVSLGPMLPMRYEETVVTIIDGRMNEFINSLVNDEGKQIKVISVLGSSCLGKTTLATALYNKVGKRFHCRAFIRVSRQPDMKKIFHDMLSQVQLHHPTQDCKEIDLVHTIKTYLQDKRYLIILDDVWDASVWDIINHAFPKGSHGSRIITTTQVEGVALTCCCYQSEHVFQMKPLDGDHSRKLFFNTPFASESSCPEQFKGDLNKIVQICGGLPLATISIASLIASQPAMTKDVLKHIHESLSSRFLENSTSERTRQALNLSFNNLPQYLKSCLLYLSMYPEGYEFFKYDLVRQWVAEGFINITEGQDINKVAESYLDQLIGRRFIQPICISYNNEVVSCAVHDAIHDFIVHKSAEENFIVAINHSQNNVSLSHMVRRLSLLFGDARYAKTPVNISKPQIRSLRFSGLFKCMPCIRDFKLLRVLNLHLSGNPGDHDSIDLTGISELFLLRYLKIACDFCIELPKVMGELRCLETLDLMDATRVAAFPWDIIHLPHLLHLTLPVERNLLDWIGSMANSVISLWNLGKLNNLHDLHLTSSSSTPPSSDHLERSMEALGTLLGGHGNLKTLALTHNDRSWHKDASRVTILWDGLTPPPLLQRFEFSPHSCIAFSRVPQWVKELGNLCILKITVKELQKNCVDILRGLPALTALSLYLETTPIDEIIFGDAGFSVLKYFKFRCSAPWLKFEADAMPTLEKLMLGFNAIPAMDQLQHGNAVISIEHMPGLKEISAKIGGVTANADAISTLRTVVSNHQRNPTINVQLVDFTFYGHENTKQKQQPDEIVGLPVGETN